MQRFALPIAIAFTALLIGIGIGRHTVSSSPAALSQRASAPAANAPPASTDPAKRDLASLNQNPAASKSKASSSPDSAENIIAKIKAGLTQFNSRHAYATFSKLAETTDASNI